MPRSSRPNILVVDDEPATQAYLCDCLTEQAPYRCTGVGSPDEALNVFRVDTVDIAVIALKTTENASMRLARQLRQDVPDLPVVLITGTRSFDAAVEAMRIGVFDYLLKPFEMSELIDAVDRAAAWRHEALQARSRPDDLLRQVAEQTRRLSDTFAMHVGTSSAELHLLLETLNQRNPATLAHARRVSQLSVPVAMALGVEEPALRVIEQGALLHDLGKIAIPEAVIHKSGPLTAGEVAIMRSHAQIGHDIAIAVPNAVSSAFVALLISRGATFGAAALAAGLVVWATASGALNISATTARIEAASRR
jgi:response regulator RpfG family c-di-GMP phosphodiesterase